MSDRAEHGNKSSELQREMGLRGLIFYGAGTILGAGIFVVIGEVIGEAGPLSPLAYVLAASVAVTSALSFSEIAARIPTAGGPIDYTEAAFGSFTAATIVGWMLIVANIVSGATITTGFVSYLSSFVEVPGWIASVGLVALLAAIASAGMSQSAAFMTVTTAIGIVTLLLIIGINWEGLVALPTAVPEAWSGGSYGTAGLFTAAFLAIYSFIGFGDMAQTAEEVKDVKRTLPRAMIAALAIVFFFYILVSAAVTGTGDVQELADASAPLVAAVERHGWPGLPFAIASLFVIVNGGLTQIIAASRLLLDLARDARGGGAPDIFARVNPATDTPLAATLAASAVVLVLALFVPLKYLAEGTSLAILLVFLSVNAALIVLKRRSQPDDVPNVWRIVPWLGCVFCAGAIVGQVAVWLTG